MASWAATIILSNVSTSSVADPGFARRTDHGEHGVRAYNGSLGAETPVGSRGRAQKDESFLSIFIQKREQKLMV